MGGPDPGRYERSTFQKRTGTLLSKAHELAARSGASVYLMIDHPRAAVVYNSVGDGVWPGPNESLVSVHRHSIK
jgi:hypothetical protein